MQQVGLGVPVDPTSLSKLELVMVTKDFDIDLENITNQSNNSPYNSYLAINKQEKTKYDHTTSHSALKEKTDTEAEPFILIWTVPEHRLM